MAPAPEPKRYPYHDQDDCPVGQKVKASGHWQYYEPSTIEETRVRCSRCVALAPGHAQPRPATSRPTAPTA